jgi:3-oxoacyl-[acyl-carrier protein] reductase
MDSIHETNSPSARPLAGKVALVTGGNRGIGKAIALRLASLGSAVSICGRDTSTIRRTANELAALGVCVH